MENLKALLTDIKNRKLSVSPTGLIKQTERNAMKSEILETIMLDLPQEIVLGRTNEGICLMIENEIEGGVPVILDIKIKNLNTDLDTHIEEYEKKQKEKKEKAEQRKRDQQASYKNKMREKEFKKEKEKA